MDIFKEIVEKIKKSEKVIDSYKEPKFILHKDKIKKKSPEKDENQTLSSI